MFHRRKNIRNIIVIRYCMEITIYTIQNAKYKEKRKQNNTNEFRIFHISQTASCRQKRLLWQECQKSLPIAFFWHEQQTVHVLLVSFPHESPLKRYRRFITQNLLLVIIIFLCGLITLKLLEGGWDWRLHTTPHTDFVLGIFTIPSVHLYFYIYLWK